MATNPPPHGAPSIIERAKNLILTPKTEWAAIDSEPATIGGIYRSYVMILAAIPPVALLLMMLLFVPRIAGFYMISTTSIIVGCIVQYLLALLSVYVVALIIDALAPTFNSTRDPLKAFKVAAYYPTPIWLASILLIIPGLGLIVVLIGAVYALYLLYLGLPMLMKTPQDKAVPYFVVTLVVAIVVLWIVNMIGQRVMYGAIL